MKCADRYYSSPYYSDFEKSILQQTKMKGEELTKYETNKTIRKKIDKLLHENHLIQQFLYIGYQMRSNDQRSFGVVIFQNGINRNHTRNRIDPFKKLIHQI